MTLKVEVTKKMNIMCDLLFGKLISKTRYAHISLNKLIKHHV